VPLHVTGRARLRVIVIIVIMVAVLGFVLWIRRPQKGFAPSNLNLVQSGGGSIVSETPAISTTPSSTPTALQQTPTPEPEDSLPISGQQTASPEVTLGGSFVGTLKLIIPVAGVRPEQLQDTFTAARSEGRSHDAIDILAPAGTPVLAASDGEIIKLFQSDRGGTTIYQLSPDRKLVFYYAHLQGYAEGLAAGKFVKQGEVIAYVGDTGNAGEGNYHLHFSISIVADPRRYWEGTNINPYPLLRK
jgi:murein DD-endopeptidase MepM/ murein hydrolase activator NlpD